MPATVSLKEYRALAELRFQIRRFVAFSEASARSVNLEPQQHQLLLAIRGLPDGVEPTIGCLAERLQIQHNSAVDLVIRCVERQLVRKQPSPMDGRQVQVVLTVKGIRVLEKLAVAHRTELLTRAPALIGALEALAGTMGRRRGQERQP
jgi:DNA-binding MarR family transcriptional regulator